jgi:hypothetical protein
MVGCDGLARSPAIFTESLEARIPIEQSETLAALVTFQVRTVDGDRAGATLVVTERANYTLPIPCAGECLDVEASEVRIERFDEGIPRPSPQVHVLPPSDEMKAAGATTPAASFA